MERQQGYYAVIQFSPVPERYEYVNIGIFLMVPSEKFIGVQFSKNLRRVEKLFGKQERAYFDQLKVGIKNRLQIEFATKWDLEKLEKFARLRANDIRLSKIQSVAVENPQQELEQLFRDLVGEESIPHRQQRMKAKLKAAFEAAGVAEYISIPAPIDLPEGITISAPFAYQNGALNLIDPMRIDPDPNDALKEAGKRAIEGAWLHKRCVNSTHPRKLIVVGDFSKHQNAFFRAVNEIMRQNEVKLYRLDELHPLLADIERHGKQHAASRKN